MAIKKSDLYSSLWKSCDELRGGMDASQYKDYVLVLLFVKYVSDKYAGDPTALIDVPVGGGFADMVAAKGDKEIGDKVNKIIGKLAVIDKLGWIKRQKAKFVDQPRQSQREMVNGESHYFLGKRYRLRVHEVDAPARVALRGFASLDLFVRPNTSPEHRGAVLSRWHRDQLRALIPPLLDKWQSALNVRVSDWGIKKMKTKWGSCNQAAGRIWINLELARTPVQCLEYIVLHELAHLIERHHNERFTALLDKQMPHWRQYREMLQKTPLVSSLTAPDAVFGK